MSHGTVTLGERTEALAIIDEWIHENHDEIAAAEGGLPDYLVALLDEGEGDFKTKARRVARYVLALDGEVEQLDAEIARLRQRAKVRTSAAARLREYLRRQMIATGIREASDPFVSARVQLGPPKVVVDAGVTPFDLQVMHDLAASEQREGEEVRQFVRCIPAQYEVDKRAVLAAHKAGEPIPAAFVIERDEQLRIR